MKPLMITAIQTSLTINGLKGQHYAKMGEAHRLQWKAPEKQSTNNEKGAKIA